MSAEKKGHSLRVIAETLVHTACRRKYAKPEKSEASPKADSVQRLTRSSTGELYFRLHCLCARFVTDREKESGKVNMIQCKNKKVDRAISDTF